MYRAVDNISADKKLGDLLQFKIKELTDKNVIYAKEAFDNDRSVNQLVSERDQFRDETSELLKTKKSLESTILFNNETFKSKVQRLEIQLKQKTDLSDTQADNITKL